MSMKHLCAPNVNQVGRMALRDCYFTYVVGNPVEILRGERTDYTESFNLK